MVAPEYLHLSGVSVPVTFWSGVALSLALIGGAVAVALRGEARSRRRRGHAGRVVLIVGAAIVIAGIGGGLVWFFRASPSQPPVVLASRIGKAIFQCPEPPMASLEQEKRQNSQFKQNMEIIGGALGFSTALVDVPHGLRIELTPSTLEGAIKFGGVTKWSIEARRGAGTAIITSIMDFPEPLGSLAKFMPIPPDSTIPDQTKTGA